MRYPLIALKALLIFALLSSDIFAQWVPTGGPTREIIKSITVSGETVLAGHAAGLFRSTNGGNEWFCPNDSLSATEIWVLKVKGNKLYAGSRKGLYTSTDNGVSWNNAGIRNMPILAIGFSKDGTFLYACNGIDLFISSNEGAYWYRISGLTVNLPFNVNSIVPSPDGSKLFLASWEGIEVSTDSGVNWSSCNTGYLPVTSMAISRTSVFAGTLDKGVYRSTDNGTSWSAINSGITTLKINSLASKGDTLFAATSGGGLFRTTNNGAEWSRLSNGMTSSEVTSLCISQDGSKLYAGSPGNVYLSDNMGETWKAINSGLNNNMSVRTLYPLSGDNGSVDIFAGTSEDGIYRSQDNAQSWVPVNNALLNKKVNSLASTGNTLLAGTEGGIYTSPDKGLTWVRRYSGIPKTAVYSLITLPSSEVYAATKSGIFLSSNEGGSWIARNSGLTSLYVRSLTMKGTDLFAASDSGVFVSSNKGDSWAKCQMMTSRSVYSIASNSSTLIAASDLPGLYRSMDHGITWSRVTSGLPLQDSLCFVKAIGENFLAGAKGAVYISTDKGENWNSIKSGLPLLRVLDAHKCGEYLYAALDGKSIWKIPFSEVTEVKELPLEAKADDYMLHQNYPNPFNPTTTISYTLPKGAVVTLTLYDMLGREVSVLVGKYQEKGSYRVNLNAEGLASGTYICRLNAAGYSKAIKMTLIR